MWRYQETQIPKNILPRQGLGKLLPLLTGIGLPSVKDVLIPSRFTAASSVLDVSTKKIFRSSYNQIETFRNTALVISNEEQEGIMKKVKWIQKSGILMKEINKNRIENKIKEQKDGFLSMPTDKLGAKRCNQCW